MSTLVLAEHEGGLVKPSSLSAVEAAGFVNKEKSITVLLAGSGPSLQEAVSHAASCHPLISQVGYYQFVSHLCLLGYSFLVFTIHDYY